MMYFSDSKKLSVRLDNGTMFTWTVTSPDYVQAFKYALNNDEHALMLMINAAKAIMEGNVNAKEGTVNGIKTDNKLMKLIQLCRKKGACDDSIEKLKPFLEKCIKNKYIDAVEELFDFITKLELKITDDGCFLAYKNVRSDLKSIHDGKTDNIPGTYVEVDKFDCDRTQTCSNGLHFCSRDYLDHYPGEVTLCVKVDPEDVVSIPTDYNYEKGRCKRYYIVGAMPTGRFFSDPDFDVDTYFNIHTLNFYEPVEEEDNEIEEVVKHVSARLQEIFDVMNSVGVVDTAAEMLGISPETVKRSIRKYNQIMRG